MMSNPSRQLPHPVPAWHRSPISSTVAAPAAMHARTWQSVTAAQMHTYMTNSSEPDGTVG